MMKMIIRPTIMIILSVQYKDNCTGNISRNKERTTVLKPQWRGSPLVQEEKYQENPVIRDDNNQTSCQYLLMLDVCYLDTFFFFF